jgi:hypothetical protein
MTRLLFELIKVARSGWSLTVRVILLCLAMAVSLAEFAHIGMHSLI